MSAGCRILLRPQAAAQRQGVRPRLPLALLLKAERVGLILCFGNWLRTGGCSGFKAFEVESSRAASQREICSGGSSALVGFARVSFTAPRGCPRPQEVPG